MLFFFKRSKFSMSIHNKYGPEFGVANWTYIDGRMDASSVSDWEQLTSEVSAYLIEDSGYPNANTTRAGFLFLVLWFDFQSNDACAFACDEGVGLVGMK